MEILKPGKLKHYLFRCSECGSVFTADSNEVLTYNTTMMITYPVMFCPCCEKKQCSGDEITEDELEAVREQYALEAEEG